MFISHDTLTASSLEFISDTILEIHIFELGEENHGLNS